MHRIQLDKDIQLLSEFCSRATFHFNKVKKTNRPLVVTQNGKSAAILIDVSEYESIVDKIEILKRIKLAESQIKEGLGISIQDVKKKIC
ncbi:MAG: type II toxin-antitoxin system prevent-host-death family antitoxin [Bacteroidetes bacterium]|nr:type II toxin-antitoxin system prevent-host-death family antitoxin [Bacteroidota bacterium]